MLQEFSDIQPLVCCVAQQPAKQSSLNIMLPSTTVERPSNKDATIVTITFVSKPDKLSLAARPGLRVRFAGNWVCIPRRVNGSSSCLEKYSSSGSS